MKRVKKIVSIMLALVMVITLMIPAMPVQAAKKIQLNKTEVELSVGGKVSLKLKNATAADVVWSTSNKSVATVSSKGKVTAKKAGSVTITAKYDGKKYKCKITVTDTNDSNYVYITETGSKYHKVNDCGTTNSSKTTKLTEDEAKSMGYEKCKKCW